MDISIEKLVTTRMNGHEFGRYQEAPGYPTPDLRNGPVVSNGEGPRLDEKIQIEDEETRYVENGLYQ